MRETWTRRTERAQEPTQHWSPADSEECSARDATAKVPGLRKARWRVSERLSMTAMMSTLFDLLARPGLSQQVDGFSQQLVWFDRMQTEVMREDARLSEIQTHGLGLK